MRFTLDLRDWITNPFSAKTRPSCGLPTFTLIKPWNRERRDMTQTINVIGAIGNTPLIKLRRASEETGCTILGKAEFMNPGGSVKDRAALAIVRDAMSQGKLKPGGVIVEGTAGNTGIGLALVANAMGNASQAVPMEFIVSDAQTGGFVVGIDHDVQPPFGPKALSSFLTVEGRNLDGPYGASFCKVSDSVLFTQNVTANYVSCVAQPSSFSGKVKVFLTDSQQNKLPYQIIPEPHIN